MNEWKTRTTISRKLILTTAENKSNRAESILKCMNGQSKASKRNRNTRTHPQISIHYCCCWCCLDMCMQQWELNTVEWVWWYARCRRYFLWFFLFFLFLFNTLFLFDTQCYDTVLLLSIKCKNSCFVCKCVSVLLFITLYDIVVVAVTLAIVGGAEMILLLPINVDVCISILN